MRLPYPFDSPWVHGVVRRWALPAWFLAISLGRDGHFVATGFLGIDATIYVRAARLWVAGGDPWAAVAVVGGQPYHFAAPPVNLVPLAPLGLMPEGLGVLVMMMAAWVSGAWIVRQLRLPWWWILFPPITEPFISGNPSLLVLALLLSGARMAGLAGLVKIYALIPLVLLGRWAAVRWSVAWMTIGVVIVAPLWSGYLSRFADISARLARESGGGYSAADWPVPLLAVAVGAIVILVLLDRRTGSWLAVPALWPATQPHYATLGMPVARGWLTWALALPIPGIVPAAVVVLAVTEIRDRIQGPDQRMLRTPAAGSN